MQWPEFLVCEPILNWPGKGTPHHMRRFSPFRASLTTTVEELKRELAHLNAVRPAMRVALRPQDIRNDGFPRANAKPDHPGIVLAFGRRSRSKRFDSRGAARSYLLTFAHAAGVTEDLTADRLFKLGAKATHPDHGGNREDWLKVREAHRLLTQEDSYQLACDRFYGWEENLRAVTKTLEALRAVERYEVVQGGEQYAGFKQLAAGAS